MIESCTLDWPSVIPLDASLWAPTATDASNTIKPAEGSANPRLNPAVALHDTTSMMSRSKTPTSTPAISHSPVHMPPFLQPLVSKHSANCGKPAPILASSKSLTKASLKEYSEKSSVGDLRLPSVPSTVSTTTADTTSKATDASSKEPPQEETHVAPVTQASEKQSKPAKINAEAPKELEKLASLAFTSSSAPSESTTTNLNQPKVSAAAPTTQLSSLPPVKEPEKIEGQTAGRSSENAAYDPSVARLIAALGASSLRLAVAAEEGLDSSPSDFGRSTLELHAGSTRRRLRSETTEVESTESPVTPPATSSRGVFLTRNSPLRRPILPAPKPSSTSVGRNGLQGLPNIRRGSRVSGSSTPQLSPPSKDLGKATSRPGKLKPKEVELSTRRNCVGPALLGLSPGMSSTDQTTDVLPSTTRIASCSNAYSPTPARSARGSDFGSDGPKQTGCAISSKEATSPISAPTHWGKSNRSPEWRLPAEDVLGLEGSNPKSTSAASHGEEEEQFSLLLQHSLGLLRREAARCFASSQASVKQKLWKELQEEKCLRLQLQQEHQANFAAAEAELISLRKRRADDNKRLEKLLEICCGAKQTEEAFRLMRTAWKGWQLQRVHTRRLKTLQRLFLHCRVLKLLLRIFLPWRAAAARRIFEQQRLKAQDLLQQEMERLGHLHQETIQQQHQELQQMRQKLASEVHLRECLQQSLIGIASNGGIGMPSQMAPKPSPFALASSSSPSSSAVLNAKRQPQQKTQDHLKRQPNALAVIGTQTNLRGRRAAATQQPLQQQQQQQAQLCDVPAQLSWWHWMLQNAGLGTQFPQVIPTSALNKAAYGAGSGPTESTGRRVKFVDEEVQQQQQEQQKLLLLANLLGVSPPSRYLEENSQLTGILPGAPLCTQQKLNSPGMVTCASAPTLGSWRLLRDRQTASTGIAAAAASDSSTHHGCAAHTMLSAECNACQSALWGPKKSTAFELECQPHKHRRWTSATHSTPKM